MSRREYVHYFMSFVRTHDAHLAYLPEVLQGGISIIKHPAEYDNDTLEYWYSVCKKCGF